MTLKASDKSSRGGSLRRFAGTHEARRQPGDSSEVPTSPQALGSVLVGALSFIVLPLSVVALGLGLWAKRRIHDSDGRLAGEAYASAGVVLGATSLGLTLTAVALIVLRIFTPAQLDNLAAPLTTPAALVVSPPEARSNAQADGEELADGHIELEETHIGQITIVDIHPDVAALDPVLQEQQSLAALDSKRVVLWLVTPTCSDCANVERAMERDALQKAFAAYRVVRINAVDFQSELGELRMPRENAPGFALLDETNTPTDYIEHGEWEENTPESISPILESFINGTLDSRRHPWRGGKRDNETAI